MAIERKTTKTPWKDFLGKLGFELFIVVAGVLIALFVNSLQERSRDREILDSTLRSLSEEFAKNATSIHRFQPRQQRFLDSLHRYEKRLNFSTFDVIEKANGMATADIYTTNWRSSLSNNSLRLLNFETVNLLSQIEAKHQELKDQEMLFLPTLYSPALFKRGQEGLDYRRSMALWLISYMGNEHELLALYQRFNELIKSRNYR